MLLLCSEGKVLDNYELAMITIILFTGVDKILYNVNKKEVVMLLGLVARPGSINRRVRHPPF